MNNGRTVLRFTGMQKLVTRSSARLDDILANTHITTEILEKFSAYWEAELEASNHLQSSLTDKSSSYPIGNRKLHEVKRRQEIAREQLRLYLQECELQTSLEEYESA